MININSVTLVGRITKDPEMRKTTSGISVCQFTIAVNRGYKVNGEYPADFISVVTWRQPAEFICKYAEKGDMVGVSGTLEARSYKNRDDINVHVTEVHANSVSIESKRPQKEDTAQDEMAESMGISGDCLPF